RDAAAPTGRLAHSLLPPERDQALPLRVQVMAAATSEQDIQHIIHGEHPNPFAVLGMHRVDLPSGPATIVRALLPGARNVWVVDATDETITLMKRRDPRGFWEAVFDGAEARFPYRYLAEWEDGTQAEMLDPYSFPTVLGELDLHLLAEGRDLQLYRKLGAHPDVIDGVEGVRFAVWAPNAQRVSVVGDF